MATASQSSDEENAEQRVLGDEISDLRSANKRLFERARSVNKELESNTKRERECVDELHLLKIEKYDRKQQRKEEKRVIELESELKDVKSENANLKQSLDQAAERLNAQIAELESRASLAESKVEKVADQPQTESKDSSAVVELQKQLRQTTEQRNKAEEELNEMRQRLSDVQERLTVAEQVTAATQQRALQESDNSEQRELEVTQQHQPTTPTGFFGKFKIYLTLDSSL